MKLSPEQLKRIKEQSKQVAQYMKDNNTDCVDSDRRSDKEVEMQPATQFQE